MPVQNDSKPRDTSPDITESISTDGSSSTSRTRAMTPPRAEATPSKTPGTGTKIVQRCLTDLDDLISRRKLELNSISQRSSAKKSRLNVREALNEAKQQEASQQHASKIPKPKTRSIFSQSNRTNPQFAPANRSVFASTAAQLEFNEANINATLDNAIAALSSSAAKENKKTFSNASFLNSSRTKERANPNAITSETASGLAPFPDFNTAVDTVKNTQQQNQHNQQQMSTNERVFKTVITTTKATVTHRRHSHTSHTSHQQTAVAGRIEGGGQHQFESLSKDDSFITKDSKLLRVDDLSPFGAEVFEEGDEDEDEEDRDSPALHLNDLSTLSATPHLDQHASFIRQNRLDAAHKLGSNSGDGSNGPSDVMEMVRFSDAEAECERLRLQLNTSLAKNVMLEEKVSQMELHIEGNMHGNSQRMKLLAEERTKLQAQRAQLEDDLTSATEEVAFFRTQMQDKSARVLELESELTKSQRHVQDLMEVINSEERLLSQTIQESRSLFNNRSQDVSFNHDHDQDQLEKEKEENTSQDYDDLTASYLALQTEFHKLQHAYADLQKDYEANKVDISEYDNLKVQLSEQKSTFDIWKVEFETQLKEQYENAMVFTTAQNTPKATDLTADFALEENNNNDEEDAKKVDIAEHDALKLQFSEQKANFEAWKVEFENQKSDFETLKGEYEAALDENQNLGKYLEDALLERNNLHMKLESLHTFIKQSEARIVAYEAQAVDNEAKFAAEIKEHEEHLESLKVAHSAALVTQANEYEERIQSISAQSEQQQEKLQQQQQQQQQGFYNSDIDATTQQHTDKLAFLKAEHGAALLKQTTEYEAQLESLKSEHVNHLMNVTHLHEMQLESLKGEHVEQLLNVTNLHEAQIQELAVKHAAEIQTLTERHDSDIYALILRCETEKADLTASLTHNFMDEKIEISKTNSLETIKLTYDMEAYVKEQLDEQEAKLRQALRLEIEANLRAEFEQRGIDVSGIVTNGGTTDMKNKTFLQSRSKSGDNNDDFGGRGITLSEQANNGDDDNKVNHSTPIKSNNDTQLRQRSSNKPTSPATVSIATTDSVFSDSTAASVAVQLDHKGKPIPNYAGTQVMKVRNNNNTSTQGKTSPTALMNKPRSGYFCFYLVLAWFQLIVWCLLLLAAYMYIDILETFGEDRITLVPFRATS